MSKEIQIFSGKLPTYLENESSEDSESLIVSGGNNYPNKISIRGSKFTTTIKDVVNGVNPTINIIILKAIPEEKRKLLKAYYDKPYSQDEVVAPRCFSSDGVKPDCADPISSSCIACSKNQFGSADVGKGKACGDSKHIYVLSPDQINPDLIFRISVPPKSFANLTELGLKLLAHKIPMESLIIQLRFDEDADYPVICFDPIKYLDEEHYKLVKKIKDELDVSQYYGASTLSWEIPAIQEESEPGKVMGFLNAPEKNEPALTSEEVVKKWGKKK